MAGVTAEGFERKAITEILSEIEADQLAEISSALDVSADGILGQLNGIKARHLGIAWELLEALYRQFDPDFAEGDALESLCKLTGTERRAASFSEVDATLDVDAGTALVSGTHFAALVDHTDVRFTPKADFTSPSDGTHTVRLRAEVAGPVEAPAGQLTVIVTPVVGWNAVTNPADAAVGRPVDTDEVLRERREAQLTRAGASTLDAVRADLLELDFVEAVLMFENTGSSADANGLPPHSFEAVVFDGESPPPENDDLIAQVIWDTKPAGIRSFSGTSDSGTATDSLGAEHVVGFSRGDVVEVYLDYTVKLTSGSTLDEAAFRAAVASRCDLLHGISDDVFQSRIVSVPFLVLPAAILSVVSAKLGLAPAPSGTADIAISNRQIARFDSARVTVTVQP